MVKGKPQFASSDIVNILSNTVSNFCINSNISNSHKSRSKISVTKTIMYHKSYGNVLLTMMQGISSSWMKPKEDASDPVFHTGAVYLNVLSSLFVKEELNPSTFIKVHYAGVVAQLL